LGLRRGCVVNSYQAARTLYAALKADPLADAHGTDELVLWTKADAELRGWGTTPVVCWEGGPYEWAVALTGGDSLDSDYRGDLGQGIKDALAKVREAGFYFEPVTSFMLAVYR
jgi:hypothetical protein